MARFFPLPEVGDIVWCRFPYEGLAQPAPKPRPALVIDVGQLRGDVAAEVIFGTSRKLDLLYSGEFAITPDDGAAFVVSGLSYPTKFNTARSVFLPYNDMWFGVPPNAPHGQTPQLGVLHPSLLRRVQSAARAAKKSR